MNLLPEEYVKQRLQYRVDMLCVLLFGLVMVSIMTAEAISSRQIRNTQVTHASVSARFSEAADFMNNFFVLQSRKTELLKEAEVIAAMTDRVPRSFLLAMVVNHCPGEVTLEEVDVSERVIEDKPPAAEKKRKISSKAAKEAEEKKKKEAKPPKTRIVIEMKGFCEDFSTIATLLQAWKVSPLVESVNITKTSEKRTATVTMREFEMTVVFRETSEVLERLDQEQAVHDLAMGPAMEKTSAPANLPPDLPPDHAPDQEPQP